MRALFEGLSGLIADTLGDPVTYRPQGGEAREVVSIFREAPVEAVDEDGHPVLIVSPSWRVPRDRVPELARGDRIELGNGEIYEIANDMPSGSPASDADVICELILVVS